MKNKIFRTKKGKVMEMLDNIDWDGIEEVFGEDYVETIKENSGIVEENMEIMRKLKFDDIEGIFERCPDIFLYTPSEFENKINTLINRLGKDYVEKIEKDISYIEEL